MSGRPVLVAENVTTGYGKHEVLHDVSVRSHEHVTCIFGPNGSGKSTLLKAIAGIVPVWSGRVSYGETDITDFESHETVRSGIATVPQNGGIFRSLSVRENLLLGAHTVDDRDAVKRRIEQVYGAFPVLEEKRRAKGHSLSGGQQMMLGFGCAMMTGAETFLLDEPTAGLAPSLVDDVIEMVVQLSDQDVHILMVEQNVEAGLRVADHVYILAQGEIQFDGPLSDLSGEDELIELYLGLD